MELTYGRLHIPYITENLKIYSAVLGKSDNNSASGEIVSVDKKSLEVKCGDGNTILLKEVQFFGGKRMSIESYLNGHNIEKTVLGV